MHILKRTISRFSSCLILTLSLMMLFAKPVSAFTNYDFGGNVTTSFTRVSAAKTKITSSNAMPMVSFQACTTSGHTASFGVYKGGIYYSTISHVPCDSVQYLFSYSVCEYGDSYELYGRIDNAFSANDYISGIWRP